MQRPAATWFGHPRGMFLVALTEFWERFSYWGLAAVLVLFLTADAQSGGWHWSDADALRLYGTYAGLGFILPALGAWLVNTVMSERRAVLWGGLIIMSGHLLLATSPLLQVSVRTTAFMSGLLLILSGTALLKPSISSLVARLYPEGGARLDEGFSYFFVAIYIGALLGGVTVGYLGERVGWHQAFSAAALGMLLGLAAYLARQREWLQDIGTTISRPAQTQAAPLNASERQRLRVIGILGLFTALYSVGYYQMLGLLNLYAHKHVDRTLAGFQIPTTWLQTTSVWAFLLFAPVLSLLWRRLEATGRNPSACYKLALGMLALTVGYLTLAAIEHFAADASPAWPWVIVAYLFFGLGDALVWAPQIALTSKLAPARYSVLLIGGWYIFMGIGAWLAGYVGMWVQGIAFTTVFGSFSAACLTVALVIATLTPTLRRWMHGAEQDR
ncbi:peptide MFS transporter [Steroidobacter sp.]|uniref:peptide MFS transporter n=1 Tax=Steroidobacter sp. TaxID=1978227 RepID=UPI001A3DB3A5|nr:peptide MFS transporter [Steroidobacter sp.]MBL8269853.1 peptide MFS transporter [Steroidobacter sp.]